MSNSFNKMSTKTMVIGALLTALSFIIPMYFPKLPLPQPFSVTFASHVPIILGMLINPVVAIFTVIGATLSFLMSLGPIVSLRAASHIIFVIVGLILLKKNVNLYLTLAICAILHGLGEVAVVNFFYAPADLLSTAKESGMSIIGYLWGVVFGITIFHHAVDCIITIPVHKALKKTKLI